MRHTLVVAAREMRELSFLLIAAAVLALIPFLAFVLPASTKMGRLEILAILGFGVASNFAIVVAMMLGATIVGREISEGRLSFYFSRPLPALSIWFGKLTAALLLTVVAFAIIALPAALLAWKEWERTWPVSPQWSIAVTAAIGLLIVLIAHAGSTAVRSRSPLVFFDLLAIGVCAMAIWLIIRPFTEGHRAGHVLDVYAGVIVTAVAITLVGAGAWQMARGRVDAQRNHYELSKFVWATLGAFLFALSIFTFWFVRVSPSDLRTASAEQAPRGPWAILTGKYRWRADYQPILLYDVQSGRSLRVPGLPWQIAPALDGRSVVWARQIGMSPGNRELCITTLGEESSTEATGITTGAAATFVLSDDGRQVAILNGKTVSVYDIAARRLVGSARIPLQNARAFFVGPNRVRLLSKWQFDAPASAGPQGLYIAEFDASSKTVTETGKPSLGGGIVMFAAKSDGSRLLVNHWLGTREVLLADGRTGAVIANLGQPGRGFASTFLSDGRIVTAGATNRRISVHVFSPDGAHLRDIDSGIGDSVNGPMEIAPNRIALWQYVNVSPNAAPGGYKPTLVVVDLDRGAVATSTPDVRPAGGFTRSYYRTDPRVVSAEPNRPLLVSDHKSGLWKWNPATGQKTKIAGE